MAPTVGKRMYSQELIVRTFHYFATSRSLYNRLRIDYQLPSIKTLTRITSNVSALNETYFMRRVFNTLKENQKQCVIMQNEIYVKKKNVIWCRNFVWKSDWWSSIPCKNCIGSYDILHVWSTHIYFENVCLLQNWNRHFFMNIYWKLLSAMATGIIKLFQNCLIQNHSSHGWLRVVYICYMTLSICWKT